MGISIAICELDSDESLCKRSKTNILKARLDDITGYETCADFDEMVSAVDAQELLGDDWEGFLKRNRINGEQDSFFLEKVKKEEDVARLKSVAKKSYTG